MAMNKLILMVTVILTMVMSGLAQAAPLSDGKAIEVSSTFVQSLKSGNYGKADSMSNSATLAGIKQMGMSGWSQFWPAILGQLGDLSSLDEPYVAQTVGDMAMTKVPAQFGAGLFDIQVVVMADSTIGGLQVLPHVDRNAKGPSYADPATFIEADVPIGPNDKPVPGKVVIPKGLTSFPIVVMFTGSGPNDKDETYGPNKTFRDLAWGLGAKGIASLRFDKRTRIYPPTDIPQNGVLRYEYMDDAVAAIKIAASIPGVSKVIILGHSEGASLAPMIAQESIGKVNGIACLAGIVTPLLETAAYQYEYLASIGFGKKETAIEAANALKEYRSGKMPANGAVGDIPIYYTNELEALGNPAKVAVSLDKPVFLSFGTRDYQVRASEEALWLAEFNTKDTKAKVTSKVYEGMNHLLLKGEGTPNPGEYNNPGYVMLELITDLANWIKSL